VFSACRAVALTKADVSVVKFNIFLENTKRQGDIMQSIVHQGSWRFDILWHGDCWI